MKLSPAAPPRTNNSRRQCTGTSPALMCTADGWIIEYVIVTLHGEREVIRRPLETICQRTAQQRCAALLTALGIDLPHAR